MEQQTEEVVVETPTEGQEVLVSEPEVDYAQLEKELLTLFSHMASSNDTILQLSVKNNEVLEMLEKLKATDQATAFVLTVQKEKIQIDPSLQLPIAFIAMSNLMEDMLLKQHGDFVKWSSNKFAKEANLDPINISTPNGSVIPLLPFTYTTAEIKQALLNAMVLLYYSDRTRSKIIVPTLGMSV